MPRILLVDGDDGLRELLRTFLEMAGYEVTESRNETEAILAHRQKPADLVILDVRSSTTGVHEATLKGRKEFPDSKLFTMHGEDTGTLTQTPLPPPGQMDIARTFTKPVDIARMISTIQDELP